MIDRHRAGQFLNTYFQPSLMTVQSYLMIFIVASLLSFVTFLRDFYSVPLLVLQFLSPFLAPIVLFVIPAALVSAGIFGYQMRRSADAIHDDAVQRKIINSFRKANIALPLVLSPIYLGLFMRYVRGEFDFGSFGLWFGVMAVSSVIGGSSLGDYAAYVASRVMSDTQAETKVKRKRDHHRLEDQGLGDDVLVADDDDLGQRESRMK